MDHRRSLIVGAALAAAAVLVWRGSLRTPEPIAVRAQPAPEVVEHPVAFAPKTAAPPAQPAPPAPSVAPPSVAAKEDLIAGPDNENHVPGAKPHPITPDHIRLQEEVALFKSGSDAVATRDVAVIRRVVREHRASYPDQNQDIADGYEILADCIEYPGAVSTVRAKRFFDEETYSTMRRPILRTCLQTMQ